MSLNEYDMVLSIPLVSAIVIALTFGAGSTLAAIAATRVDIKWIKKYNKLQNKKGGRFSMKKIVIIFLLSATFIGLILSHLKCYISIETLIQSLTLLFTIIAFMVNLDVTQSQIKTVMKKSEFDTRIEHLKLFSEYYDSCVEDCNNEIKRREEQHKKMKDDYLKKWKNSKIRMISMKKPKDLQMKYFFLNRLGWSF